MNQTKEILATILNCGTMDIKLLDEVEYDLAEIVKEIITAGEEVSLSAIVNKIFQRGISELKKMITNELEDILSEKNNFPVNSKEFKRLQKIFDSDELTEIENHMGFEIM